MNKVKIMLTAMIIIGTVGGVLAIKSKRVVKYCTAALPAGGPSACPDIKCTNGTIREVDPNASNICYKATTTTANCAADNNNCTGAAKLGTD